jgi:hypothetical protein
MSIELRDRFFALSAGTPSADEVARYRAQVDAIDPEPAAVLDGLAIAWHPSARHKAVRFVDAERIDAQVRELFARPSAAAPHLAAVFVDPRELSFRTFENIVPLDRLFDRLFDGGPLELELARRRKLAKNAYAFALQLPAETRARLDRLDSLGLYVPPLNAVSRGGERFIFHSARLAEALTVAVAKAIPRSLLGGFSHVNPVFRCNRFEPGDASFHRHHDTPYFDAARQHVSRYTVLLYLTGGSASPALDLTGRAALDTIEALTCVIFDQRYEHEGAPYQGGRKVFLRTELVFTAPGLEHDPAIAERFSKACYWTGESVFAPELARHADAYYDQVAAAHWSGLSPSAPREPFAHKQFRGVHFVANGHDFWFAKSEALSVAECAAITLLDYFNCKLGDSSFRALCRSTVVEAEGAAWIPAFLEGKRGESACGVLDKAALFPAPEEPDGRCCPFHCWDTFDATRNEEIVDLYTRAQSFAKAHIMPAPILMLGQDVVLDPDKFVIHGNLIHVLGKESLAPVNFAACWNAGGSPENYLDVAASVGVLHLLVPPIFFTETAGCYHLQFDFFRNSWMVKHQQATVPVPMIRTLEGLDPEELDDEERRPWMDAVDPALVTRGTGKKATTIWWADRSPLISELYDAIDEREEDDEDEDED